ncbi:uncharacterized protein LOC144317435 isoform X2 [Canis aureus]
MWAACDSTQCFCLRKKRDISNEGFKKDFCLHLRNLKKDSMKTGEGREDGCKCGGIHPKPEALTWAMKFFMLWEFCFHVPFDIELSLRRGK